MHSSGSQTAFLRKSNCIPQEVKLHSSGSQVIIIILKKLLKKFIKKFIKKRWSAVLKNVDNSNDVENISLRSISHNHFYELATLLLF